MAENGTAVPVCEKRPKHPVTGQPQGDCLHIGGAPFMMGVGTPPVQVQVRPMLCCWCGLAWCGYLGVVETGHGQHAVFQAAPAASQIVLAHNMPKVVS